MSGATLEDMMKPISGAISQIVRPDGTRLRTVEHGEGDPILLLHGYGMTADAWSLVQPELVARGRRVIAFDHRGHGASTVGSDGMGSKQMRGDVKAIMEAFNIERGAVACHSMSNFIALGLLHEDEVARRLNKAVLVNPLTGHAGKSSLSASLQMPLMRLGVMQRLARIRWLGKSLAQTTLGPAASPAVAEATRQAMIGIPLSSTACLAMQREETVEPWLSRIRLPLHVLTATHDETTPAWHAELIAKTASNVRIDYVQDAGHMLNWEAPDIIIEALLA